MVKLGEVASYINGYAFKPEDRGSEGLPIIRIQDLTGNSYDLGYYSGNYPKKIEINDGDILISWSASLGVYTWNKGKALLNQHIFKVEFIEDSIDKKYFVYAVRKKIDEMIRKSHGATMKHIIKKDFEDTIIPYPTLEEQYKIADELDRISKIIDMRNQELRLHDDLIRARFVEMFEGRGKVVLLTNYVWFQEGPGVRSVDFAVEGTNLLTGSNINDNELSFGYKSDRFISNELANGKYAHFMCDKDDILVVSSAIAPEKFDQKVVIVEEDKKYCLNTGIIRFKPNREVMTLGYFREFLKTDYFKHQVMAEMRGIAQMHFGPSHLKQMTILLPESMEQQIEFEKFITQVNKSKVEVKRALDEAQLLFDSLMQKYFG